MEMLLTILVLYILLAIYLNNRTNQNYLKSFLDTRTQEKVIGDLGEDIVIRRLNSLSEDFIVENDVHLDGVQIDHLVINHSLQLCFVIETKLWGGKITGTSKDDLWRQDKNGKIKLLDNPIMQNKYHCRVVKNFYQGYHIFNIVVFVKNKNIPHLRCIVNENGVTNYIIKKSKKFRALSE
jgi:hypothetical protein